MSKWYVTANGRRRRLNDVRCGTPTGYTRHQNAGEKPCDACTLAKREYDADWRAQPERVLRSRLSAKAQYASYRELARRHKVEYDALYAENKAVLFTEHGIESSRTDSTPGEDA